MSRALASRYGRSEGKSLENGYIPGRPNQQGNVQGRLRQLSAAHSLHRHFYNNNLDAAKRGERRASAAALLDEAAGALEVA